MSQSEIAEPADLFAGAAFYPLNSPGMPPPGPDFLREAALLGDPVAQSKSKKATVTFVPGPQLDTLYRRALYEPYFTMNVDVKGTPRSATFLPGHLWGLNADGPRRSDVMLIGKHPGEDELKLGRNFAGPASEPFLRAVQELEIPEEVLDSWYVTNLVKHNRLTPGSDTISAVWIKNCLPLLHEELKIVKPKYILCMGNEAAKALLDKSGVTNLFGQSFPLDIPIHDAGEAPEFIQAQVMACHHPASAWHEPANYDIFLAGLQWFWELAQGHCVFKPETDLQHEVIRDEPTLKARVDQLLAEGYRTFAVDAEWHGEAREPGGYLRCVQVSWKAKHAFCLDLRAPGGAEAFQPSIAACVPHLKRLLKSTPERRVRIIGHFFRSDLPWLMDLGVDLRAEYAAPPHSLTMKGWERAEAGEGGIDTGILLHAVRETGPFNLEYNASRLCGVPVYNAKLKAEIIRYCKQQGIKEKYLEGYGEVSSEILHSYATYDSDACFRLYEKLLPMVGSDEFGNNCWRSFWQTHRASLAFLEMEREGLILDMNRGAQLTECYLTARAQRLAELRELIHWPAFNPGSHPQCRELLFGEAYNKTKDNKRLRPAGAMTLNLEPIKPSGKGKKNWERVVEDDETDIYTASTDKEVLGIMSYTAEEPAATVVRKLRDVRFITQIVRTVLRPPKVDENGQILRDDYGEPVYDGGLMGMVRSDGRIRTRLSQVKETARASSSNPNLQALSKRREADYERILGDAYLYPIRSIFRAPPGWVTIEADLKSAELAGMAWMCNAVQLIEDVRRNCLPEDHPDYYEIHSQTAVRAFRLNCQPTKKGLKDAKLSHLRVAAKNVAFGIPYGRGPDALQRQCHEEGAISVTQRDAVALQDFYFKRYPETKQFLDTAKARSQAPGFLVGAFGMVRHFAQTDDQEIAAKQQREACNFPIQNLVAHAISEMLYQLQVCRQERKVPFKLLLQLHDAVLFCVPIPHLSEMVHEIIPECMSRRVEVRPCFLDGRPMASGPYHFGVDISVHLNWGIPITHQQALEQGIPLEFAESE